VNYQAIDAQFFPGSRKFNNRCQIKPDPLAEKSTTRQLDIRQTSSQRRKILDADEAGFHFV
jgi:hypothetical protein